SLDWWVGAGDRWHLPSREMAVRQSRPDAVPVVETAMRIPGGDAVQRVYAVPGSSPEAGGLVVVEVENRSAVPVAVAFAVRPYNAEGLAVVGEIELADTAITVSVDGRPALLLPRPPAGVAGSTFAAGDCVHRVTAGQAAAGPLRVEDADGLGQAALVYALPHRGTVRVGMPLAPERRSRRIAAGPHRAADLSESDAARWPGPADVARGWQARLRRGLQLDLPDSRLGAAVDANRADPLLFHTGAGIP